MPLTRQLPVADTVRYCTVGTPTASILYAVRSLFSNRNQICRRLSVFGIKSKVRSAQLEKSINKQKRG